MSNSSLSIPLEYTRIRRLFTDRHTRNFRQRQALALRKIVRDRESGFKLAELDDSVEILSFAIAAVDNGADALAEPLCDFLRLFGRRIEPKRSYNDEESGCKLKRMLMVVGSALLLRRNSVKEVEEAAADALRQFIDSDQKEQSVPLQAGKTIARSFSESIELQLLDASGVIPVLVRAIVDNHRTESLPSLARTCRDVSLSSRCCQTLVESGIVDALPRLFAFEYHDAIIPWAVEIAWNILELAEPKPGHPSPLLSEPIVQLFTNLFAAILKDGYRVRDKVLRNQILAVLFHLSSHEESRSFLVRCQSLHIILKHSTWLELDGADSTVKSFTQTAAIEDVQMKKLMWAIIGELAEEPRSLALCVDKKLMEALLVYTDLSNAPTKLQLLTDTDLDELALRAMALLFRIAPLLPGVYSSLNASERLIRVISMKGFRVATADLTAIRVVLEAVKEQNRSKYRYELSNCVWIKSLLHLFSDKSRPIALRSDAVCIVSQLCQHCGENRRQLRKLGALSELLKALQDEKDNEFLLATLDCLWTACSSDARNLAYVLALDVIDLLMDLSRRTPRVLRRVILSLLDDMLWNRRSVGFLEEYRSGRRSNDAVSILLGFWTEEEDLRGIDTNSADPIADTSCTSSLSTRAMDAFGCWSAGSKQSHNNNATGQLETEISSDKIGAPDPRTTISSILRKLGGDSITSLTPIQKAKMRTIVHFDEFSVAKKWKNLQQKLCEEESNPLPSDENVIINSIARAHAVSKECREQQDQDLAQHNAKKEQCFNSFVDTVRAFIVQEQTPPETKGGNALIISTPSKLKLTKEKRREMLRSSLQQEETSKRLLGSTYSRLYEEFEDEGQSHSGKPRNFSISNGEDALQKFNRSSTLQGRSYIDEVLNDSVIYDFFRASVFDMDKTSQ